MEMLYDWNSFVAFHAGEVQATCAISSVVDLQNLLCTTLVLRVVFNLKNKPTLSHHWVASKAENRRAERGLWRWVFIVACLASSSVRHCWLQLCPRQDHPRLGYSEERAGNQSWEREEEKASYRGCLASCASRSLKIVKLIGLLMIETY